MNKPLVVLADTDASYLVPLEDKLTEELYDQIELEIITDREYFNEYFSMPRKIDTLIISKDLFSQEIMRHDVTDFFVLSEEHEKIVSTNNVTQIFKYSSTKEIFNQIIYKNRQMLDIQISHRETEVVLVTSPIGGAGKTSISLALSSSLAQSHKRVLYISLDAMQNFAFYLTNKTYLPNSIAKIFNDNASDLYKSLLPYLRNEGFSYLPPFGRSLSSLGMDSIIYTQIISAVKASKEYDYIVVDTDANLDEVKAELFQKADKVIVTVLQDAVSTFKFSYFVQNIDCRNSEKFMFVCNKFNRNINNEYVASSAGQQFIVTEYIDELPTHKIVDLNAFCELTGIKNLTYVLS